MTYYARDEILQIIRNMPVGNSVQFFENNVLKEFDQKGLALHESVLLQLPEDAHYIISSFYRKCVGSVVEILKKPLIKKSERVE